MVHAFTRRGRPGVAGATALVAALGALASVDVRAQEPTPAPAPTAPAPPARQLTNTDVPWRTSYFPYLSGLSNDGPLISFRIRRSQAAPYEERVTARGFAQFDAGIGFRGTRFAVAQFGAPLLIRNWRFAGTLAAMREARYGFFGIGNQSTYDAANVTDANPFFYRVQRTRYQAVAEATRRIAGPLQVALQASAASIKFVAHDEGTSVFLQQYGSSLKQEDAYLRAALVLDTRDTEYDPHKGVLLEAGYQVASGGAGYERAYGVARGWLQVREGTVLAARLAGSQLYGDPTLDARYVIPAWERPIPVLGGSFSLRGIETGRLAGKGVLLGNFEARQDLVSFANIAGLILIGFVDAGRVFEDTRFRLTTDQLTVAGGAGLALRVLRTTAFSLSLARGPE
ncbi:MAG: BamA/TamA family outer membrane protein, partial [Deltaproteobacteria bacterium]